MFRHKILMFFYDKKGGKYVSYWPYLLARFFSTDRHIDIRYFYIRIRGYQNNDNFEKIFYRLC